MNQMGREELDELFELAFIAQQHPEGTSKR